MASGSRGRGQQGSTGAGAGALDTLANPDLAHLPAVDLLARLLGADRRGSDVADVAHVLAARERRLAEAEDRARAADEVAAGLRDTTRKLELRASNAEDRVRAADEVAAGLRDTIRKLELRAAANAEALARNSALGSQSGGITIIGGKRVVACEDHQSSQAGLELQIVRVSELTAGEIRARDLTASETTIVVPVLPPGERKKEPAAASEPEEKKEEPLKKPKTPGALFDVASKDSDSEVEEAKEELCFTEAQGWEMLDVIKAQVAAWKAEYDAADAASAQGTLQAAATPPMDVEEVQTLDEQQAHHESGRTVASDEHDPSRMIPEVEVRRVVPTGVTKKKAQRQKGVSFCSEVSTSDMKKKNLIGNEENEESLKKQAAVTGSKPHLRGWWSRQAPHLSGSQSVEEDSGERKLDKFNLEVLVEPVDVEEDSDDDESSQN